MFVIPTFGLGVVASPPFTSVFDGTLSFPTIQVFDMESEFIDQTDAPDHTIVHAKDTNRFYIWDGTSWYFYNNDSTV